MTKLMAFEGEDPKIRASIYATARLAFDAWNEPAIAHSASLDPRAHYHSEEIWEHNPVYIDLDWVMGGPDGHPRTLYMSAPSTEFERLAPVFGGMLGDLREQLHAWDIAGRKLDKPLLILIDLCRHGDYADLVVGVGAEGLVRAGFAGWCGAMVSA